MNFFKQILKSNTMRQLTGAVLGVMAAGVIYVIVNQYSTSQLSGLLVDTNTVTENADRVRVNDKNVDDEKLRRIATRAQTVADALEDSKQPVASSVPTLVTNANDRAAARAAALAALTDRQNAPTYTVDPRTGNVAVADRLAIRTARIQQLEVSSVSSITAVISQETPVVPEEQLHSGAPLAPQTASPAKLPSSGLGTVMLTITTLVLTVGIAMRRAVAL